MLSEQEMAEAMADPQHVDHWNHGNELAWFGRIKYLNVQLQAELGSRKSQIESLEAKLKIAIQVLEALPDMGLMNCAKRNLIKETLEKIKGDL